MSLRNVVLIFGAVGLFLPIVLLGVDAASPRLWPQWILYVWPTSYMLGATSGEKDIGGYLIIAAAIAINAVLYGYVGSVLVRLFRRKREHVAGDRGQ